TLSPFIKPNWLISHPLLSKYSLNLISSVVMDTQTTRYEEGILGRSNSVLAACFLDIWKDVCANESSNLASGGRNGIILASNTSSAGLGSNETDVVPW